MRVWHVHIICTVARGECLVSRSITLHLPPLRQGPSLNLEPKLTGSKPQFSSVPSTPQCWR